MNGWEIVIGVILGLLVNEMTDLSPWAARRLVRWAAYRWTTDPDVAAGYAEEWTAIIEERPGKLLKLLTATQFSVGAARRAVPRTVVAILIGHKRRLAELRTDEEMRGLGPPALMCVGGIASAGLAFVVDREELTPFIVTMLLGSLAMLVGLVAEIRQRRRSRLNRVS
ncbi:hypothetical protein [Micromonospora saelicesensis]|uniref:Uncharacterized protein n=1 Tax=Micromonospora saelicesensis TaxID=285676 RepID=A0A1C4YFN2_9ACTN|nr:hypothetical protein [Micromonospora saelicesensis]SCF19151.1 hypothetical protein GA0070561_4130 [Micromonospora saelicesensis]